MPAIEISRAFLNFRKLLMENLSPELEDLLASTFKLRKILEQVLPQEAIEYIINLIAKDGAHRKFLKLTEENEHEESDSNEVEEQN